MMEIKVIKPFASDSGNKAIFEFMLYVGDGESSLATTVSYVLLE